MNMRDKDSMVRATGSGFCESRHFRICGWAVCCLCGILAAMLLAFAWYRWPVLDGDSIWFVPPMVTCAKDGSLLNAANPMSLKLDPVGGGRLIQHGFLYAMVVGKASPLATYPSIILTMAMIEALALAACAFVLDRKSVV